VQDPISEYLGGLCVYRMPQTTGDAATDAAASLIRNRLAEMSGILGKKE
jgi:tRNA U34 5-methylaminomethyl-2-thiouridine-forming methyltransferase MnmC